MKEQKDNDLNRELKEWREGWEKEHDSLPEPVGFDNGNLRDKCNQKWAKKKLEILKKYKEQNN